MLAFVKRQNTNKTVEYLYHFRMYDFYRRGFEDFHWQQKKLDDQHPSLNYSQTNMNVDISISI